VNNYILSRTVFSVEEALKGTFTNLQKKAKGFDLLRKTIYWLTL